MVNVDMRDVAGGSGLLGVGLSLKFLGSGEFKFIEDHKIIALVLPLLYLKQKSLLEIKFDLKYSLAN